MESFPGSPSRAVDFISLTFQLPRIRVYDPGTARINSPLHLLVGSEELWDLHMESSSACTGYGSQSAAVVNSRFILPKPWTLTRTIYSKSPSAVALVDRTMIDLAIENASGIYRP